MLVCGVSMGEASLVEGWLDPLRCSDGPRQPAPFPAAGWSSWWKAVWTVPAADLVGWSDGVSATRGRYTAESVRTPCDPHPVVLLWWRFTTCRGYTAEFMRMPYGTHPVISPLPARGVLEISAVCGSFVVSWSVGNSLGGVPICHISSIGWLALKLFVQDLWVCCELESSSPSSAWLSCGLLLLLGRESRW